MNDKLTYTTLGAGIILFQILLNSYVNLCPVIYIAVFPLFLFLLPYPIGPGPLMFIGFGAGLCADILSDGVPGLNAAAAVAVAYFRKPVLDAILSKGNLENLYSVNIKNIGLPIFSLLCLILYGVFFLFYIALDGFGSVTFLYSLIRFFLNLVINTLLALLIEKAFIGKIIK